MTGRRLDGRRRRLRTSAGELTCDFVVNAAGAWAQEVGELLGADTPILPQRHQAVSIHLPRTLDYMMPEVMDYAPAEGRSGLYFRHETFDMFLGGLHSEEAIHPVVDPDNWFEGVDRPIWGASELLPNRLPPALEGRAWEGGGLGCTSERRTEAASRPERASLSTQAIPDGGERAA